jgi:hypothetical protein
VKEVHITGEEVGVGDEVCSSGHCATQAMLTYTEAGIGPCPDARMSTTCGLLETIARFWM